MLKLANEDKVRKIPHGKDERLAVSELGNGHIQKGC